MIKQILLICCLGLSALAMKACPQKDSVVLYKIKTRRAIRFAKEYGFSGDEVEAQFLEIKSEKRPKAVFGAFLIAGGKTPVVYEKSSATIVDCVSMIAKVPIRNKCQVTLDQDAITACQRAKAKQGGLVFGRRRGLAIMDVVHVITASKSQTKTKIFAFDVAGKVNVQNKQENTKDGSKASSEVDIKGGSKADVEQKTTVNDDGSKSTTRINISG